MADKGIIFSAPMVRALLNGTKTQTRRLLNSVRVFRTPETAAYTLKGEWLQRALQNASRFRALGGTGWVWEADALDFQYPAERTEWLAHLPYAPGDRLYVREAWRPHYLGDYVWDLDVTYAADGALRTIKDGEFGEGDWKWPKAADRGNVPSIHMPRWASRLWLEVTEVRVQRAQEISEQDAIAEGIEQVGRFGGETLWKNYSTGPVAAFVCPIKSFRTLWNDLHTKPGETWADNPWIVAISFNVHKGNIDEVQS